MKEPRVPEGGAEEPIKEEEEVCVPRAVLKWHEYRGRSSRTHTPAAMMAARQLKNLDWHRRLLVSLYVDYYTTTTTTTTTTPPASIHIRSLLLLFLLIFYSSLFSFFFFSPLSFVHII
jgi:hypothetical protein